MTVRVAINGFGRIGRLLVRLAHKRDDVEVVAINSRADVHILAHLLKYDSVHRIFDAEVSYNGEHINVDNDIIRVTAEAEDQSKLPWKDLGVDIVLESTGQLRYRKMNEPHLEAGAKRVLVGAPGKDQMDQSFVYGINHDSYDPEKHFISSNTSCTTNCLAPVVKILHDNFTIKHGLMNTTHSYTMDQRILDGSHENLRRARAAAMSIVPTTTGAAKNITKVIPDLAGKLDGMALRVPTANVSVVDLVCNIEKGTTTKAVNQLMKNASRNELKGIMAYTEVPLVSVDYTSSTYSSIFDATITNVIGDDLLKVFCWYDNEMGYSARMLDMAAHMAKKGL